MASPTPPPPSGGNSPFVTLLNNVTVSQLLLRYLALEDVRKVFGIPGGGLLNLLVEFKNQRKEFEYVICRQETGAAYIADGYHRATGKLGVVMVTSGPGATNALTGVMNAQADGSSLIAITGEVAEAFAGKGPLQEGLDVGLDINSVYRAAVEYSAEISDQSEFQTLIEQALRDALSIPGHATHISLPSNVPAEPIPAVAMPTSPQSYRAVPGGASRDQVALAMAQLVATERPLIFLGNGCREALRDGSTLQALTGLVERYGIPVMTTPDGKGVFPETHPLSLRVFGFCSCLWPSQYMAQKDVPYDGLLVLGSGLRGLATDNFTNMLIPQGPFIHVDLDQAVIGRAYPVSTGVVGEAGAFIREMTEIAPNFPPNPASVAARTELVTQIKLTSPFQHPEQYESNEAPIRPAALVRVVNETVPEDAIVVLDAGNCVSWGIQYLVADPPKQVMSSLAMGPMGFGVCAVVGAKMGRPDKTCVALVGDGAFLMHGAEISTAATHKVGAIWIVLQDNDYLMVSQGENFFFPDPKVWPTVYEFAQPDLARFSEGLGADAYTIGSTAELKTALTTAIANAAARNKPQVIVAQIDKSSLSPYFFPPRP